MWKPSFALTQSLVRSGTLGQMLFCLYKGFALGFDFTGGCIRACRCGWG